MIRFFFNHQCCKKAVMGFLRGRKYFITEIFYFYSHKIHKLPFKTVSSPYSCFYYNLYGITLRYLCWAIISNTIYRKSDKLTAIKTNNLIIDFDWNCVWFGEGRSGGAFPSRFPSRNFISLNANYFTREIYSLFKSH